MNENSKAVSLRQPDEIVDPLTNIVRAGARQLLARAVEIEAETFLAAMKDLKLPDGRDRVVRHGHGPTRMIQTGIGPVEVERVKIRDRGAAGGGERVRFTSAILPLWARRTKSLDALLPVLYLRGILRTGSRRRTLMRRQFAERQKKIGARKNGETVAGKNRIMIYRTEGRRHHGALPGVRQVKPRPVIGGGGSGRSNHSPPKAGLEWNSGSQGNVRRCRSVLICSDSALNQAQAFCIIGKGPCARRR
jgi:hypothetical protein